MTVLEDRQLLSITTLASFNDTNGYAPGKLVVDEQGNLYGTTTGGYGTVFEIAKGSNAFTTLASFNGINGSDPGCLVLDGQGNLYGATSGAAGSRGTVFEIAKGSNSVTTLASFNWPNGYEPNSLTLDGQGNLYGTTMQGGAFGYGTVFEIAEGSNIITTLASFDGTNGNDPNCLVLGSQGNLYGTTLYGGAGGNGTVFEIVSGSNNVVTLASFDDTTGPFPYSGVVMDGQGNLYGTTNAGGAYYSGTVFEIPAGSNTITTVASFNGTNGANPYVGLVLDGQGNLYGTTSWAGAGGLGTVFEIARGSNTITTLACFNRTSGHHPRMLAPNSLVLDSQGNLYGTAYLGGDSNNGTVFEIAKGSNSITALASFSGTGGHEPNGLVVDSQGNLYGTTTGGYGTVFEIAKGSRIIANLVSFDGNNGANPSGGLVRDSQGNLYGTTQRGGTGDYGTVFEIARGSSTITTLACFNGTNGRGPDSLVMDSQGNLYGTTQWDGASGYGTVFEIARGSSTITILASFAYASTYGPSTLVVDSQGNLYGTAEYGGASGYGTVFEIPAGSNTITILASFDETDGAWPNSLVMDSQGNLYGTTQWAGPTGYGTVFEIAAGSNTITILASFNSIGGSWATSLVLDGQDNLYGTTRYGGTSGAGTVFEIARGSNIITTLTSFHGPDGANPGVLVPDGQGNLYGTTEAGGTADDGTVFELSGVAMPLSQSIAFAPLASQTYGVAPITLSATATSGLAVGFSVVSGSATIAGNVLTITGAGTVVIEATQPGNGTYPAATPVDQSFTVSPALLTITPTAGQSMTYGGTAPTLTYSYTGLVNNDTSATFSGALATTASSSSGVGGYAVTEGTLTPSGNYTIGTFNAGTLTVNPAPLTIRANNATKVYGAALPTFSASYRGFVNGDTAESLTVRPMISTSASAASHVTSYAITAGGATAINYSIAYVTGTLAVTPAPLTISANSVSKTYGAAMPNLTASYSGFVNGDSPLSLTTAPSLSTSATAASHVANGPYPITASGASASDYAISYTPGTLTIVPAPLTITANPQTKVYGAALPTLTANYSGLVNGDTPTSLTTQPTLTTTAITGSHVTGSSFAITITGAVDSDYAIVYVGAALSVTPAPLTITANGATKIYGAALPTMTASYSGWVNGDSPSSLTTPPSVTTTATAASHIINSGYPIMASGASDPDYAITYVPGTLTINPAPLTIVAENQSRVYGAALPTLTASYLGLVNGDTPASLATSPILTTTATASSHVRMGGYSIIASDASDPDYAIAYQPGTLTITPAPLAVTANNASKVYGASLPSLTASYDGFVNGDTAANLASLPTLGTTASAASHVDNYAINATGAASNDYTINYLPGTLIITPAPLTITANNASMVQGTAVPPLSATYSGFVNGESAANLAVQPTIITSATAASPPGTYLIGVRSAIAPDYAIHYENGIFIVTPAPVKVLRVSVQAVHLGKSKKATQVIVFQFTGALNPGAAQGTSNYGITTVPASKKQKSQPVALSQAQYNAATNSVTLITRKPLVINPALKLTYHLVDPYGRSVSGAATLSKKGITW